MTYEDPSRRRQDPPAMAKVSWESWWGIVLSRGVWRCIKDSHVEWASYPQMQEVVSEGGSMGSFMWDRDFPHVDGEKQCPCLGHD